MITMHPTRRVPGRLQTIAFALAALIAVVDQAAKAAARAQLDAPINLTPFLALRLGFNPGVTFGLFAGSGAVGRWALSAVASLIIGALLAWIWRTRRCATARVTTTAPRWRTWAACPSPPARSTVSSRPM